MDEAILWLGDLCRKVGENSYNSHIVPYGINDSLMEENAPR